MKKFLNALQGLSRVDQELFPVRNVSRLLTRQIFDEFRLKIDRLILSISHRLVCASYIYSEKCFKIELKF